jgi:hypothetical protein
MLQAASFDPGRVLHSYFEVLNAFILGIMSIPYSHGFLELYDISW